MGKRLLTGYANHGAQEYLLSVDGFAESLVSENRGMEGEAIFPVSLKSGD